MKRIHSFLIPFFAVVACTIAVGFAVAADSVAGKWEMALKLAQGPAPANPPVFQLTQEGEKIGGTYTGSLGTNVPVTGTLKGNQITFSFTGKSPQVGELPVEYVGTVEGAGSMKGVLKLGGMDAGTFEGKKK